MFRPDLRHRGDVALGTIRKCTGAHGWMSWKASISSSSYTLREGILPSTILQKMQFGIGGRAHGSVGRVSQGGRPSAKRSQPRMQR